MNLLVVGDIAGQFDALMRLVAKVPDRMVCLVGDLVDRGPKSKEVVEWAMGNPKVGALKGNHEHMMVDFFKGAPFYRDPGVWLMNGGLATLKSYGVGLDAFRKWEDGSAREGEGLNVEFEVTETLEKHLKWLDKLPLYFEFKDDNPSHHLVVTHGPIYGNWTLEEACDLGDYDKLTRRSVLWNRYSPKRKPYYQIYGHNAQMRGHSDTQGEYAMCIDDSRSGVLSAVTWPERELLTEPFVLQPRHPSKMREDRPE